MASTPSTRRRHDGVHLGISHRSIRSRLVDLRTGPLPELQDLLNPKLLDKALSEMDTDDDGSISKDEWTEAVGSSLTKLLDERQKDRDADNEFAIDFQTKAREVFEMIDVRRRCPNRRDVRWIVCAGLTGRFLHRRTIHGRSTRRSSWQALTRSAFRGS